MSVIRQLGLLALLAVVAWGGVKAYERYYPAAEDTGAGQRRGGFGPAPVKTEIAGLITIEDRIEAVGTTLAVQAVDIVAMTSGRIVGIEFKPGQTVMAKEVLVRLDDDIQRADMAEAKARLSEARLARTRAETLAKSNTISRASIEQLTAALAIARAQLDRAERRLADRKIIAPFSGVTGLTQVETGTWVDEKTMITTLDDLTGVRIEFALPETQFGKITTGLPVMARSSAFPGQSFTGQITEIDSRIDTSSRSFKVRAELPNRQTKLPAGMFMHLSVILNSREGLMISEEAVTAEAKTSFVYVIAEGKAKRRAVTLGSRDYGRVEILDGLVPGESVVIRGLQRLRDGAPVREGDAKRPGKTATGKNKPGKKRPPDKGQGTTKPEMGENPAATAKDRPSRAGTVNPS